MTTPTQQAGNDRRLVPDKEGARLLGISWRTFRRLADAGKIPQGYKLGALRRWDLDELHEFINNGCKQPKPARGRA